MLNFGDKHKSLTFIKYLPMEKTNRKILVKCDCGKEIVSYLSNWGRTSSCGCKHRKIFEGSKFSRLTVVSRHSKLKWLCRCDCGTIKAVFSSSLLSGETKSCGCWGREEASNRMKTHGMSKTITYASWRAMLNRCNNPNDQAYPRYGGRGITVCDSWLGFNGFLNDMGVRPDKSYTLDRADNEKGYHPNNCRWATWNEQANNRSCNVTHTFNGETMTVAQWADKLGWTRGKLFKRLYRGWSFEKAVTTP